MKVLLLASTALKSGGSLHSLTGLAECLIRDHGVEASVVLPSHGSGEELLARANVPYRVINSFTGEWPLGHKKSLRGRLSHFKQRLVNLQAIRELTRMVREDHFDIVHANTSIDEIGYYIARRAHVPLVWHLREFPEEGLGIEYYDRKRQLRHMAKADVLIAVSNAVKDRYQSLMPKANIRMVHNGIDVKRFYRPNHSIRPEGKIVFVSIGRISREKGHYNMVDACEILVKDGIGDFELRLVGNGGDELKDIVHRKNLDEYVRFVGFRDDVPDVLADSDVLIAGSKWEAFGRATVEAMAAGCFVIGAKNAGTLDLIRDGESGLFFDPDDIGSLANAMGRVIRDRTQFIISAKRAQEKAASVFTRENNADAVHSLYLTL